MNLALAHGFTCSALLQPASLRREFTDSTLRGAPLFQRCEYIRPVNSCVNLRRSRDYTPHW
jgi:hypothetical protein